VESNGDEILCAVINDHIRAECATELRLLVIADRGKHRGAMQLGELDGRVADAAGAAMDECRLAGPEPAAVDQIGPGGEEIFRQCGRLRETESARDRQAMAGVSHAIFRVGAAGRQRADLVADVPLRDFAAARRDAASDLQSKNGRGAGRRRVAAGTLLHFGPVDAGKGDFNQDLARPGRWHRTLGELKHLRSATLARQRRPTRLQVMTGNGGGRGETNSWENFRTPRTHG
jgi:hypothetical protein